jgi:hypothetical protein
MIGNLEHPPADRLRLKDRKEHKGGLPYSSMPFISKDEKEVDR